MKRFRIDGLSVISNFDRDQSAELLSQLTREGLLDQAGHDIYSVTTTASTGQPVRAHVSPWEVALVKLPQLPV